MSGLFDVSKEIILITGASQGLGRQFARVLSAHGAAVVLAAQQTAKLKSLEDEIRAKGGRAAAVQMDVTDIAIDRQGDGQQRKQPSVRSAWSSTMPASPSKSSRSIRPRRTGILVINANLKGAYFLATEMARRMIARKQEGNIVNIASVLGSGVMKFLSPYAISKAGIIQATKAMALELAANRIRVNALAPGYIDTEMNHDFWSTPGRRETDKTDSAARASAPNPISTAPSCCLPRNASRYMTGSVVTVDGGFLLT